MEFKAFERGLWNNAYNFVDGVCKIRLGYEIISLYENPKTRKDLKVSPRENDLDLQIQLDIC